MSRIIEKDGITLRMCSMCKECLPLTDFCKNKQSADKLNYRCKPCSKKKNPPELFIKTSNDILQSLGYDTDPNNPIPVYKQFLMKHNLQ